MVEPCAFSLDDRYEQERGPVFLTGVQALIRLMLEQRRRDRAAGFDTAGFVSGYRGSPLGGVDRALWEAADRLAAHDIRFEPAINEELAATALIGTQQAVLRPDATVAGVFGMWYGKGPGLDRAGDALKHANSLGASPLGGVLVVVGDDHGAVSSSMAHQCEQVMASWMMPVLHPVGVHEYLDHGLLGIAMSRFSGAWVGFKAVSESVETAMTVDLDPARPAIVVPDFPFPPDGPHIRLPDDRVLQEARLQNVRLPAVQAFARANRIDRVVMDAPAPRLGIAATGKAYLYLRQAMDDLGLDEAQAARFGIRLYKVGMSWPLEPSGVRDFADGLEQVLVVEEKRAFIETQIKDILYHLPERRRPRVVGKTDEAGKPLLPGTGELSAAMIARALVARLPEAGESPRARAHLAFLTAREREAAAAPILAVRPPYFCSGCPHNRSTVVPEGSRALAGTGCHLMVLGMERETSSILHMGAEGVNWLGQAPYVADDHVFQNLGDGTYVHSGILGIRQAVASGAHMTFKILFNDAVAMTGGQPPEGRPDVAAITAQVAAEGVRHVAVVADDPGRHRGRLAPGVAVHHRDRLDQVQRRFRDLPGVSVIVYDQTCATELRRRRRRGLAAKAGRRVYINQRVCEGCGDCAVRSNCLSVVPVETPFGRKRMIDQSSCNQDLSCLDGFCPAIVTLDGAEPRRRAGLSGDDPAAHVPDPVRPALDGPYGILVTGIGGTGVVTVGQVLAIAAHMEGRYASTLDFTGLAQKGGGVLTHVRIAPGPDHELAPRLPTGGADLALAADMVVATGAEARAAFRAGRTQVVAEAEPAPTAASILDPDFALDPAPLRAALEQAAGAGRFHALRARAVAETLTGDAITANMFLLGYAYQLGAVPVGAAAILRAIEVNKVMVEANRRAFAWGRLAAHMPSRVEAAAGPLDTSASVPESLEAVTTRLEADLVDYGDEARAARWRALVQRAQTAEARLGRAGRGIAEAVARGFHRLLAVKDEYEVARLFAKADFAAEITERFAGGQGVTYHFSPPYLPWRKIGFGPWMGGVLRLLARARRYRGRWCDPFRFQAERKTERALIDDYERMMTEVLAEADAPRADLVRDLARLPERARGFGPVKDRNVKVMEERKAELLARFRDLGRAMAAE